VSGPEAGRVVAAMEDVQIASRIEVEIHVGGESVDRPSAVRDSDPTVAPLVASALP
jgi:hypothetical protein